ncbi:type 1 glutamine amidotransferase [Actinomycetospora soli]|uniref:type 1 glutamine amidotransferase n=1 Tax=Actinomycetospora soli TaxID=2893887 RepID=UPI001E4B41D5|nr:glutamine amidotransferase [Actinomycetospora soli]MCD2185616.1 glutamine amidotransferase [Actinomycetospora soli]
MSARIVLLLPEVLGTYGDAGNAAVLATRLRWRGIDAAVHTVGWDDAVPEGGDVYVLGGGEDAAQLLAVDRLRDSTGLRRALDRGAPTLAVCAGLQILGRSFTVADGTRVTGLEVLDVETVPGRGARRIGDVTADPLLPGLTDPLVGFENHGGVTTLGADAAPLARVRGNGAGNGTGDRLEGAVGGSVVGTYVHGPVLARNPALADLLLTRALGALPPLEVPEGLPSSTARRLGARFPGAFTAADRRRAGA